MSAPVCGDGTTEYPEQCDDGNPMPRDGCSEHCLRPGAALWAASSGYYGPLLLTPAEDGLVTFGAHGARAFILGFGGTEQSSFDVAPAPGARETSEISG